MRRFFLVSLHVEKEQFCRFLMLELLFYLKLEYVVACGMKGQHRLKLYMIFINVEICLVYLKNRRNLLLYSFLKILLSLIICCSSYILQYFLYILYYFLDESGIISVTLLSNEKCLCWHWCA